MSTGEDLGLKGGHPPAVKAGGMRVVSKHKAPEKQDSDAFDKKYLDQLPEQSTIAAPVSAPSAHRKGNPDVASPIEIIKTQKKPIPTVEKAHSPSKIKHINQPRK